MVAAVKPAVAMAAATVAAATVAMTVAVIMTAAVMTTVAAAAVAAAVITAVSAAILLRCRRSNPLTTALPADGATGAAAASATTASLQRRRHQRHADLPASAYVWLCWDRAVAAGAKYYYSPFISIFSLSSLALSHSRTRPLFRPFSASRQLEARAPRREVVVRHASPTPARTKT